MKAATVGVAEHVNTAVLVTLTPDGKLLDRRSITLTTGLPTHPHHRQGSWAAGRYLNTPGARAISLAEAVALVEKVQAAAALGARASLDALATVAGQAQDGGRRGACRTRGLLEFGLQIT